MARRLSKEKVEQQEQLDFELELPAAATAAESEKLPPVETPPVATPTLSFGSKPRLPEKERPSQEAPVPASAPPPPVCLSVGELTRRITGVLEDGIGTVWVEGEVSNLRRQPSGHIYFTLKDEMAQLSCVLFARTEAGAGRSLLRDGLQVQLQGQISVYQSRGQYQLLVKLVQPKGEGMLQARFEELKRRLAAEGLFDQERKRPIPSFPKRIGVVTSPSGAAIQDFLKVLHRRHPGLRVVINPVRVQGKGAAAEIAAAINEFSEAGATIGPVDVVVVTRGGGSLEDLWEFNEEVVARAIASCSVPVVSAVGHEIDFSIADFAADLRASTPSAAAELLAADGAGVLERCRTLAFRIGREALASAAQFRAEERRLSANLFREPFRRIEEARQICDGIGEALSDGLERRLEQVGSSVSTAALRLAGSHPRRRLAETRRALESLGETLGLHARHHLERRSGRLARLESALSALSPEATLRRGFSITRDAQGKVLLSATQVGKGAKLRTQLAEGEIISEVKESD